MNNEQIDNTSYYRLPNGQYLEDYIFVKGYNFAWGSAIKYHFRAGRKDGESMQKDIAKANHYVRYIAITEKRTFDEVSDLVVRAVADALDWTGSIADAPAPRRLKNWERFPDRNRAEIAHGKESIIIGCGFGQLEWLYMDYIPDEPRKDYLLRLKDHGILKAAGHAELERIEKRERKAEKRTAAAIKAETPPDLLDERN